MTSPWSISEVDAAERDRRIYEQFTTAFWRHAGLPHSEVTRRLAKDGFAGDATLQAVAETMLREVSRC